MTFASKQLYLTWGGYFGGAGRLDIWQCGLHMAPIVAGGVVPTPNQAMADDFLTAAQSFHASNGAAIASACTLAWAKIAYLDEMGDYIADPLIAEDLSPQPGSRGAGGIPTQVALAVTLWSGGTLGKANYGRFYIPQYCGALASNGTTIDQSEIDELGPVVNTFLGAAYDAIADNQTAGGVVDVSNMSFVGSGLNKRVTKFRLGHVKDTQRRRRNAIPENYTSFDRV